MTSRVVSVVADMVRERPLQVENPTGDPEFAISVSNSARPRAGELPDLRGLSQFGLLPDDLVDLWSAFDAVRLFEDRTFGQWGLVLWDPDRCAAETAQLRILYPGLFRNGDLVIGEWLGDTDLVIIDLDTSSPTHAHVLVANPLDDRGSWPDAAESLTDFVSNLVAANGEKFWAGASP